MPGEFWRGSTGYALANGLRLTGTCVTEINIGTYFAPLGRLSRLIGPMARLEYNAEIIRQARHGEAQIMIACKGNEIMPRTLTRLKQTGVRTVNFYPDYHFDHPRISAKLLDKFDLFVTTKVFHLDHLRERFGEGRFMHIPHGYAPEVHRPRYPVGGVERYEWDISYVGTASHYKVEWLAAIAEAFPGLRFAVFGNGWRKLTAGTPLARHVAGTPMVGDYLAKVYELSRINIGVHYGPHRRTGWIDHVSTRTFEIPASGGFALHIDSEELRTYYDVPHEMAVFSTPAGLIEAIDHYLRNDDERRAILCRGYARAVPAYSFDRRAAELLGFIEHAPVGG